METIGEKIYNLRKEKDVSQEELSFALNVSRQTVSRWERDNSKPTESNIRCLCKFFGVDKNYFSEITVANVLTDEVTNGKQSFWKARAYYKIDNNNWEEYLSETLLFDEYGKKLFNIM